VRARRATAAVIAAFAACATFPPAASAHGFVVRSDLPIPEWLFGWAAAVVLIVSFVGLAILWPEPRLQDRAWRPLPRRLGRIPTSRPVELATGAIGLFLFGLTIYSGLKGEQTPTANFATVFVYIVFWVGLVPVSVLLGDVFRAFNPWRAAGRAVAWVAQAAARGPLPAPLEYPSWLGRWPATVGILAFAVLELVVSPANGSRPDTVVEAALVYSALTFVAMALFGVEAWIERGEAFSVYFNLFSRLSVFERRDREVGLRRPLSGLASLQPLPGTVALLAVMIGSTSFDGLGEAPLWTGLAPHLSKWFGSLGLAPRDALEAAYTVGLLACIAPVLVFYRLGVEGAKSVGGGFSADRLAGTFVHSLVPIALAYVSAHYLTFLVYQGQLIFPLASNPLGHGTNPIGSIDYAVLGATAVWYLQVAFVVCGHVAGLTLAHDRALGIYDRAKLAVRSQYWMLAVMVGFTSLALFILSQSNV
jgi:hypothetical protein